ncbi:hypothetical protein RIR_jg36475.t1 [Rhizophagus irregularis DAOM 181602=DAOM 197198]|nr:hypothetical protein RhiirB3_455243 [Rhizophagus irregularis]GET50271.1 hypothetical protein RIR_jg32810.t1 [Rhizophagus irregularis DAOM 181602=DAOM 197198]GET55132.1 hypothetical protein RIR_jg15289.t1 [Rhizophagus irregularis DAOM 181602=DAOM 197198]GET61630.1 hypothetical protein RIR_jg35131.t1 [Rhizophagus irregularis DAOM 181602=DAOM 197198]GET62944.1 hypothetical protein RIR_jg36475.t1 [Rhizophagus irregularis DAOM 181602=DAOM 197198]
MIKFVFIKRREIGKLKISIKEISQGLTRPSLKENRVSLFQNCENVEEEADLVITDWMASRRYFFDTEEVLCLEINNQRKL